MKFIETLSDLEAACDTLNVTVQITYRVRVRPKWCVHLHRRGATQGDVAWRSAVSEDLSEAFELCIEAWTRDEDHKQQ